MSHPKQTPFSGASPEVKGKPTQANDPDVGLVGLLKDIRQNETKDEIIQREINALTVLGSKLIDEKTAKENRVKGKKESYKQRKLYVQQVHAEIKESTGKNPRLKLLVRELEKRYPARLKTNIDVGFKAWTEGGVKDWWAALNKGLNI
jgi:hypothetical protein